MKTQHPSGKRGAEGQHAPDAEPTTDKATGAPHAKGAEPDAVLLREDAVAAQGATLEQSTVRWGNRQATDDDPFADDTVHSSRASDPTVVHHESLSTPTLEMLPHPSGLASTTPNELLPEAFEPERFVDCGLVAKGGMGTVHMAHDKVMLRQVALKFLTATENTDPSIIKQFVEEAQITGQLTHPNIVPVYDLAFDSERRCFFAMKYVDGETYTTLMQRYHAADEDPDRLYELLQVFLKVCDAVAFAHERGVVHCDLKPDNVMVGSHGQVYVMDWGVALLRTLPGADTEKKVTVRAPGREGQHVGGTPSYMAPEQAWARPEEIDHRTDVYGLGGLLHYLLTGKPPNYNSSRLDGAGHARDIALESSLRLVPPGLCRIAERALCARPQKRQASATELKSEVEGFLAGGGWFATETFSAGQTIIKQGDVGDSAYVITRGECDVFVEYPEGPVFVRTMGPGEVFGEMAVLTGKPRSATVMAKTTVHFRVITKASLEQELRRNPLLGSFVRTVVSRFSEHQDAERQSIVPPTGQ